MGIDASSSHKPKLYDFRKNRFSQFGEDGVIEKIFEVIGPGSKVCIEFGAWDGFYLSNTAALWTDSWKGILIEADQAKYLHLKQNVKDYNCVAIHASVGIEEQNDLETILRNNGIHDAIDLLSIDIDGNDYYVFDNLNDLKPRVIICEYNPTIPASIDIYADYNNYFGCSVAALMRVAKSNGYQLVALTDVNAFFVQDEEFAKFSSFETDLEKIRIDKYLHYLITSFSGEYLSVSLYEQLPYGLTIPLQQKLNGHFVQPIKGLRIHRE